MRDWSEGKEGKERERLHVDKIQGTPLLWDCAVKVVEGEITVT